MRYVIIGVYKDAHEIVGYEVLPVTPQLLTLQVKPLYMSIDAGTKYPKMEFANAEIVKGKITLTVGSAERYPQYTGNRTPIQTKRYSHEHKIVLVARCAVRASSGLKEAIFWTNEGLKVYSYDQLQVLSEALVANRGCVANGSIRKTNGAPEITTWHLTPEQREKALYIYAKPVLKNLQQLNKAKLQAVQDAVATSSEPTKEPKVTKVTDQNIMLDGILVNWGGDPVNPEIPEGVKELGAELFSNSLSLKTVKLPSTLKVVGDGCFQGCINLEKVDIEHNNIEKLNDRSFFGTRNLKSYSLSPKTDSIGEYAFAGSGLEKIDLIMPNVKSKGKYYKAGSGEIGILENAEAGQHEVLKDINIGYGAFAKNYRLASVEFICDKPISIGERAFEDCEELRSIKGDYTVKYIGDGAFENTSELTDVDTQSMFSPLLTYVGDRAFHNSNIKGHITLWNNVTYIGTSAFESTQITKATVYIDSLKKMGLKAFSSSGLGSVRFTTVAPEMKTLEIEPYCFGDCVKLTSISIPKNMRVKNGESLCASCSALSEVKLGGMTSIPSSAFFDCPSLTEMNLSNIKVINSLAFSATGLTNVQTSANRIEASAFSETPLESFEGKDVYYVGYMAFASCPRLKNVLVGKGCKLQKDMFKNSPYAKKVG